MDNSRQQRLRLMLRALNRRRKRQARQIDILCNDIVTAQKDFISRLETIGWAADFYRTVLAEKDLETIMERAEEMLSREADGVSFVFFIRGDGCFDFYGHCETPGGEDFLAAFTPEVLECLRLENSPCGIAEMPGYGLDVSPALLKELDSVAVPLCFSGTVHGLLVILSPASAPLGKGLIERVRYICPGLARAVSCRSGSNAPAN